jgi:hypothetical protein
VRIHLIYPQRLEVALDGFRIIPIGPMHQSKHVPADVAAQVVAQAAACKLIPLFFSVHAVQYQPLHRQRFPVLAKFGGAQDLLCILEALLVLLLLVVFLHTRTRRAKGRPRWPGQLSCRRAAAGSAKSSLTTTFLNSEASLGARSAAPPPAAAMLARQPRRFGWRVRLATRVPPARASSEPRRLSPQSEPPAETCHFGTGQLAIATFDECISIVLYWY